MCALNFRTAVNSSTLTTPGSVFEFLRQFFAQTDFKKISFEPRLLPYVRDRQLLKSKAQQADIFLSNPIHDTPHVNLLNVNIDKLKAIQDGLNNLTHFELRQAWQVPVRPQPIDDHRARFLSGGPSCSSSATMMYKAPPALPPTDLLDTFTPDGVPFPDPAAPAAATVPQPAWEPRDPIQAKAAPPALRAQLGIDLLLAHKCAASAVPQAAAASTAPPPCAAAATGSETAVPQAAVVAASGASVWQQPAPAAVAASGNLKLPPSWRATTTCMIVPLFARGCKITRAKIDETHEVVVSYPPSAQEPTLGFGQLPVVFYVGGVGNSTIIAETETTAMKKAGGAKFSKEFLRTIDSVIWITAVADARTRTPWKTQPEMWMLEAAAQLRACQSMPIHFIGFSRGAWWGSVFATERPDLFASIWLIGGYPGTSEVNAQGKASAIALRQCHVVNLIGSIADTTSPAQAYDSWYAMNQSPTHRSVVFESLTQHDLLAMITLPPPAAAALSGQMHSTLVDQ